MPKARKKKAPIAAPERVKSATSHATRTIIRKFHALLKRKAQLEKVPAPDASDPARTQAMAAIDSEMSRLGGMEAYQRMSVIGQSEGRGGGSEKVFIDWLKDLGMGKRDSNRKLRLLEVGALKPDNYQSCRTWIESTTIDLRPRHPDIIEQDFFLLDEKKHRENWDLISLSLVLNFVPEPQERGRMLHLVHKFLRSNGLIFLTLPLPCVSNSRYLDFNHLKALMEAVGFREIKHRWKVGGKMGYWLYEKANPLSQLDEHFLKKMILRRGDRNNFCILL